MWRPPLYSGCMWRPPLYSGCMWRPPLYSGCMWRPPLYSGCMWRPPLYSGCMWRPPLYSGCMWRPPLYSGCMWRPPLYSGCMWRPPLYSACMWRLTEASRSASLFPSTVTCDGTLIQITSRPSLSSSVRIIPQIATVLTGSHGPTHSLIFHRFAAPWTPSGTYAESEQMAVSDRMHLDAIMIPLQQFESL